MITAVIGAAGFVGNRLVETIHLDGGAVVPVVRTPARLALPARFAVNWRLGDALNVRSLAEALRGCDTAVHAALGDPSQIERMPAIFAAAAAQAGVKRVVYLSTASVHGQAPEPGTDEGSPLHTRHRLDYNNAKVRAERSFFRACRRHRLDGFALRPGIVYGPRSRWIADSAQDLREGRAWLVAPDGGICNAIHVDNLVAAVRAALHAPSRDAGAYLVGDEETVTWRDFLERIAAAVGVGMDTVTVFPRPPAAPPDRKPRLAKWIFRPALRPLFPLVPAGVKRTGKVVLQAMQSAPPPPAWRLRDPAGPRLTEELCLLQQCRWKLPHARAAQRLGYRPPLRFADGMARSLAWLAFAEGRTPSPFSP